MRHHHETFVELRPNHKAPPLNLRGITSWPWDTTMKPSWNYVLAVRHHYETFVELHPSREAPPRNLHGITSLHEAPPW